MPKTSLRCKVCRNKVGESENGATTFRHKGRTVCVESGIYPCVVTVDCETCKAKTVFEICPKEVNTR